MLEKRALFLLATFQLSICILTIVPLFLDKIIHRRSLNLSLNYRPVIKCHLITGLPFKQLLFDYRTRTYLLFKWFCNSNVWDSDLHCALKQNTLLYLSTQCFKRLPIAYFSFVAGKMIIIWRQVEVGPPLKDEDLPNSRLIINIQVNKCSCPQNV